ncbi:uncharacterized protein LOC144446014 [Glandiceps talaboti]
MTLQGKQALLDIEVLEFTSHADINCKICNVCDDDITSNGSKLLGLASTISRQNGFVVVEKKDAVYCLKFENQCRYIKQRLEVQQNGTWNLEIHGHVVTVAKCPLLRSIPLVLDQQSLSGLFNTLCSATICAGNQGFEYLCHEMSQLPKQPAIFLNSKGELEAFEEDNGVMKTVRHTNCELLSSSFACHVCKLYRRDLSTHASEHTTKRLATDSKRARIDYLEQDEKAKQHLKENEKLQKEKDEMKHQIASLQERMRILTTKEEQLDMAESSSNADIMIQSISEILRDKLPVDACVKSENIQYSQTGPNADCDAKTTVHVDKFLYDDQAVDDLCEEGKLSQNYCKECGSHSTAPLTFISHSFSLLQLKFIFQHALPDLSKKTVVDVGSRLGAVLYGAYYYSAADNIIGIEMNKEFCELQQEMVDMYQLNSRVQIICADVCSQSSILQQADVIVLNNVFEFFSSTAVQSQSWKFLGGNLQKTGCILVTVPSLEESLQHLSTDVDLDDWVKPLQLDYDAIYQMMTINDNDMEELEQIHVYQVI